MRPEARRLRTAPRPWQTHQHFEREEGREHYNRREEQDRQDGDRSQMTLASKPTEALFGADRKIEESDNETTAAEGAVLPACYGTGGGLA